MSRRTTRSTLAAAAAKAAASTTASQKKSNNSSTNNKTSQLQQQQHTNTSSKKRRRVSPRRILSSRNQQVQENLRVIGASTDTSNSKALHLLLEDATATGSSSSTEEVEGQEEENNNSDDVVTSTRTTKTTRRKKRQRIMGSSSRRAGGGGGVGGARAVDPDIPCISSEEEYSQQTTQTQANNNNGSSGANSTSAVPVPINGTAAAAPAALPDLDLDPDPEAQQEEEEASVSDGGDRSGDTEVDDAESQHSGASRTRNRSSRTCNKKRKRQVHQSVTTAKRRSTRFLDTTTSSNNGGDGFGSITRTSASTGTFNKATKTTTTTPSRSLRACQQQPRNTNSSSSNSNSKSKNTTNRLDTTARNQGSSVNSIQVELISLLRTIRRKCDRHDIFSHPVNPEEDECPDYFDYVPKDQVMDLGTMENLIRNGTILNMDTFEVYMERILRCAKLYNTDEESFVFSQIEVLENESKPFIEKCRQKIEKMLLRGSPVKFTKEKSDDEENEDDPELEEEDYNSSEEELLSSEVDETEFDDEDEESTESEDVDHCKVILKIPRGILSSKKQQRNKRRKQQRNDNNSKKSKSKKTSTNNKLPKKKKKNNKKQKQQRQQKRLSKSKNNARKQVHQNEEQQQEDKDEDSSCVSLDNSVAGVDIPYCSHDLSESNVCAQHALSDWVSIIPEMVKVCNEAARRAKLRVNPSAVSFDKPLSENYIKDRLEFSGKVVCGYTVRATGAKSGASCAAGRNGQCIVSRGRGRPPRQVAVSPSHHQGNKPHQVHEPLQGFVIVNKFITWRKTLEFTHPSFPASGMFPIDPQNHKCDNDGTIATQLELLPRYHHQDEEEGEDTTNSSRNAKNDSNNKGPSPEGSIALERVAEIALLGGLGCGSYLLTRALQELDATRKFDYVCLQSTKIAIPFYERHGFVRVGAVARYNDDTELPFIPYRHWSEIVSGDVGVGAQQEVVEPSYMMALRLPSAAWSKEALSKLRVTLGSTPVIPPSPTTNRSASNATEEGSRNSIRETMIRNSSIRCLRTLLIQAFTLKMQRSIGSKITYQELLTLAKKYAEYAQEHKILTILNRALQESVTNTIGSSKAILRIVPGLAKVCSALLQDGQSSSSVGGSVGGTDGCIKPFFSSSDIAMSRKKEVVVSQVFVDGQNVLQEEHNDEDLEDNSVSLMALLSDTFFSGHSNNVEKGSNPVNDDKNHEGESEEGKGEGNGNHQQQQKNMSTKKNNKKSDSNDNILVSSKGRSRRNEVNGNIFYCEINVRIKLIVSDDNDEEDDAHDGDNKQEQSFDEPLVAVVRS